MTAVERVLGDDGTRPAADAEPSLRLGDLDADLDGEPCDLVSARASRPLDDDERFSLLGDAADAASSAALDASVGLAVGVSVVLVRFDETAGLLARLFLFEPKKRLSFGVLPLTGAAAGVGGCGLASSLASPSSVRSAGDAAGAVVFSTFFESSSSGSDVEAPLPGTRFSPSLRFHGTRD